jgi:hypothetical protein
LSLRSLLLDHHTFRKPNPNCRSRNINTVSWVRCWDPLLNAVRDLTRSSLSCNAPKNSICMRGWTSGMQLSLLWNGRAAHSKTRRRSAILWEFSEVVLSIEDKSCRNSVMHFNPLLKSCKGDHWSDATSVRDEMHINTFPAIALSIPRTISPT